MKKILIVIIIVAALVVGAGGAYLAARAVQDRVEVRVSQGTLQDALPNLEELPGLEGVLPFDQLGPLQKLHRGRMMDNFRRFLPRMLEGRPGLINPNQPEDQQPLEKITLDKAVEKATAYVESLDNSNLVLKKVMQFENNFFALVEEKDSGMGAFQLVIGPYGERVTGSIRPLIAWNTKYGHRRFGQEVTIQENTVSMADAAAAAQAELDAKVAGAKVEAQGTEYFGYYTFTYKVDGKIAGLISVNGLDKTAWLHTSHGDFIAEKEVK